MALTVSTLGVTLTSTAAVEKLTFEVDEWEDDSGNLRSAPYQLKITVVSGNIGYEVVAKGATAPAMTNATLYTTTDDPIQTVFNPYSQDLYIKSTIGDTYSISSNIDTDGLAISTFSSAGFVRNDGSGQLSGGYQANYQTTYTVGFSNADYIIPNQTPANQAEAQANATVIQGAIDAVATTGGVVEFKEGTFITTQLVWKSNVNIRGQGQEVSVIQLYDGEDTDLIITDNFSTLFDTGSLGGVGRVFLRDITLDGNKANQGTPFSTDVMSATLAQLRDVVACLKIYGYHWVFDNVEIKNGRDACLATWWSSNASNPTAGGGMESHYSNCKFWNAGWCEALIGGPHDSNMVNTDIFGFAVHHLALVANNNMSGGPLNVSNCHIWGICSNDNIVTRDIDGTFKAAFFNGFFEVEGATGAGQYNLKIEAGGQNIDNVRSHTAAKGMLVSANLNKVNGWFNYLSDDAITLDSTVSGNQIQFYSNDNPNAINFASNATTNWIEGFITKNGALKTFVSGTINEDNYVNIYGYDYVTGDRYYRWQVKTGVAFLKIDENGQILSKGTNNESLYLQQTDGTSVFLVNTNSQVVGINNGSPDTSMALDVIGDQKLSGPAGSARGQFFATAGTKRMFFGISGEAESGGNAGSNFIIDTYSDVGGYLATPFKILRSNGDIFTTGDLNASTGNVNASSYSVSGSAGASGSFTTTDGKTVTVTNGLITSIV